MRKKGVVVIMKQKVFSFSGTLMLYAILIIGLVWFAAVGIMWVLYLFFGSGEAPNDLYRIPGL